MSGCKKAEVAIARELLAWGGKFNNIQSANFSINCTEDKDRAGFVHCQI
jgi:hypothetical protein